MFLELVGVILKAIIMARIKNKLTVGIKECLQEKMDNIFKTYEENGMYPYELFTLMCGIADTFDIIYTMELHGELMGV